MSKVAIVTGAGTKSKNVDGVGMAIAILFAKNGAKILIADIDEEAALITQKTINNLGGESSIFITDIANEKGCRDIVETTTNNYGTIDIVVNSVAISGRGSVTEITRQSWDRVIDVNINSLYITTRTVLPKSRKCLRVEIRRSLSRWCRPIVGSSRIYNTPTSWEPI